MSSEIEFGDLEHNEPQVAVRPDRDGHFCIAQVGELGAGELPIYVDLDVMRDMEAHAISNTRVELGGVMLGKQCIDAQGNPFVLISDSLRADHYEATRGSFKFTHETWNQITNQRNRFKPDLEMVGWYHTHPGWTVFLSPMDMFICNNFFNRPLDVALVIDPCAQDRGWFQWDEEKQTQRTGGFFLTTNRYRQQELLHFARLYNNEPEMNVDPRYSGNPIGISQQQPVNVMDTRNPLLDFLLVGMLMCQLCFMGWMMWQMKAANLDPASVAAPTDDDAAKAQTDKSIEVESLKTALTILASQNGDPELGNKIAALESQRTQLAAGLDGQLARVELLNQERNAANNELRNVVAQKNDLKKSLTSALSSIDELETENIELVDQLDKASEGKNLTGYSLDWVLGIGLLTTLLGGLTGYFLAPGGRQDEFEDFEDRPATRNDREPAIDFETARPEAQAGSEQINVSKKG